MTNHPKKGFIYAITKGTYIGEMFAYIKQTDIEYNFISIPKNINRSVPVDTFLSGLRKKIVEPVEELPKDVYNILEAQHAYNEKSYSGRKQPTASSLLGSKEYIETRR